MHDDLTDSIVQALSLSPIMFPKYHTPIMPFGSVPFGFEPITELKYFIFSVKDNRILTLSPMTERQCMDKIERSLRGEKYLLIPSNGKNGNKTIVKKTIFTGFEGL